MTDPTTQTPLASADDNLAGTGPSSGASAAADTAPVKPHAEGRAPAPRVARSGRAGEEHTDPAPENHTPDSGVTRPSAVIDTGDVVPQHFRDRWLAADLPAKVSQTVERIATYRGDCRDIVGNVKGPDTRGRLWLPALADYDPATDRTRVGFAHIVAISTPASETTTKEA